MKFKQQEETPKNNSFYDSIKDLLCLNAEFEYAIRSLREEDIRNRYNYQISDYVNELRNEFDTLIKLAISLDPKHKHPTLELTKKAVEEDIELLRFEEKYYNMIKEIGKNAIEEKEFEVLAYLSEIVRNFKHYFCTIVHEDNNSGETSS